MAAEECDKQIEEALKKAGLNEIKLGLEKEKEYIESQLKLNEDLYKSSGWGEALQRKREMVDAELKRTDETITEKRKSVAWGFVKLWELGKGIIIEPIFKRLRQLMDLVLRTIQPYQSKPAKCIKQSCGQVVR